MRKPIGIANDGTGSLMAICSDGTTFVMLSPMQAGLAGVKRGRWVAGATIPGTEESREMVSLRKITTAWNHYWNDTCQKESDVNDFFNAVKSALEDPF